MPKSALATWPFKPEYSSAYTSLLGIRITSNAQRIASQDQAIFDKESYHLQSLHLLSKWHKTDVVNSTDC